MHRIFSLIQHKSLLCLLALIALFDTQIYSGNRPSRPTPANHNNSVPPAMNPTEQPTPINHDNSAPRGPRMIPDGPGGPRRGPVCRDPRGPRAPRGPIADHIDSILRCSICAEKINPPVLASDLILSDALFGCHHPRDEYCDACLVRWLRQNRAHTTCMLCRAPLQRTTDALVTAARAGVLPIVNNLLEHGVNVNGESSEDGRYTALCTAAEQGHLDVVTALLTHPNIDVNGSNHFGDTALMGAARNGHSSIVQLLLNQPDVEVNASTLSGNSALVCAIKNGKLVSQFDDARIRHFAMAECLATLRLLLARPELDVNSQACLSGETALMHAANGPAIIVEELLAQPNINVNLRDFEGQTALDSAHDDYIRRLLIAHGAVSGNHSST